MDRCVLENLRKSEDIAVQIVDLDVWVEIVYAVISVELQFCIPEPIIISPSY